MIAEQIFQLKINTLSLAQGDLAKAKELYEWVTEEVVAAEEAVKAKQESQKVVKLAE